MQLIQHPHAGTTAIGLLAAALLLAVSTFTVSGAMCLHDLGGREIAASLHPLNAE